MPDGDDVHSLRSIFLAAGLFAENCSEATWMMFVLFGEGQLQLLSVQILLLVKIEITGERIEKKVTVEINKKGLYIQIVSSHIKA